VSSFIGLLSLVSTPLGISRIEAAQEKAAASVNSFRMVRSSVVATAGALPHAIADVKIVSLGPVEQMDVFVEGLPPNTEFDLFILQVPDAPFGMAWYMGDIETDAKGRGHQRFIGRFSIETFTVAQGPAGQLAPIVHDGSPFADASLNPETESIHMFHLGLWFNSPDDAAAAGLPATVTRFNGDHTAGVQVLSTRQFSVLKGPLGRLGS